MEEEFELKDIADELLILPKLTIDKLFQLENAADCIALYMLYYKTAKWQKTNQPKANDAYVKKCLKWGFERIRNTKQSLKEQGLIDIIQSRKDGKINGWFVKVSYLVTEKQVENIKIQVQNEDSKNIYNQDLEISRNREQKLNALKENNKCLNNINNKMLKKDNIENIELKENIKCIIDYLNESINSKYKYDSKETIKLIKARFKEGYVLDNFYDVIDKKVKEWFNTEMQQYLRPSTLFGNKFEQYLNQPEPKFKGKIKSSYSSNPTFDNTANHDVPKGISEMTKQELQNFKDTQLAKDSDGNYYKF